jgi:hypothetical protein
MAANFIKFDSAAKADVLEALNLAQDSEGFVVEKNNLHERVLTREGEEVPFRKLGIIEKGSLIFTKSDFFSLMNFVLKK